MIYKSWFSNAITQFITLMRSLIQGYWSSSLAPSFQHERHQEQDNRFSLRITDAMEQSKTINIMSIS